MRPLCSYTLKFYWKEVSRAFAISPRTDGSGLLLRTTSLFTLANPVGAAEHPASLAEPAQESLQGALGFTERGFRCYAVDTESRPW